MDRDLEIFQEQELGSVNVVGTKLCPTCGIRLSASITICPNDKTVLQNNINIGRNLLKNYELIGEIGSGGMGVIFKARHLAMNQLVAIKMLLVNRMDEVGIQRFSQEAKAISLLDHPSIVRIRDYGVTETHQPYMVLDYIDGNTLEQTIAFQGQCPTEESLEIFLQVADALSHAHANGILHRDLKPSNIMIVKPSQQNPTVKIVDFGIAKIIDSSSSSQANLTKSGEVFGSPQYMSPEQASGTTLDARSDIYSLGCVMYATLTGAPPFTGKTAIEIISRQLNDTAPSLRDGSLGKAFPDSVEAIVKKALSKNPDDRFQTMTEVKNALLIAKSGSKQLIEPETREKIAQAETKKINRSILAASLLLLACTLCLIGWFSWKQIVPKPNQRPIKVSEPSTFITHDDDARLLIRNSGKVANLRTQPLSDSTLSEFDKPLKTETIMISDAHLTGHGLAHLIHLPLRRLALTSSEITDDGWEAVGKMIHLQDINLEQTKVSENGLRSFTSLSNLQNLGLDDSNLTAKGLSNLKDLPIEDLTLNWATGDWKAIFGELKEFRSLRRLYLQGTHVTDDDLKLIQNFKQLHTLDLGDTDITEKGIANLKNASDLQVLLVRACKHLNQTDFTVFKKLKVDYLDVRNIEINEDALCNLENTRIRGLNLSETAVTDHALDVLSKIKRQLNLQIEHCPKITPARVQALKKEHHDWLIFWRDASTPTY